MTTLTKEIEHQVTVLPNGLLECREATLIMEDGKELSRSYHRHVIEVGADVSNECQLIQDTANQLHTPERIAARKVVLDAQSTKG